MSDKKSMTTGEGIVRATGLIVFNFWIIVMIIAIGGAI